MKNAVTRSLYDYWTRLRGNRIAPERGEIEPADIRTILGDTFILEAADRDSYVFRLAGTRMCAAYCRELKGRNFLDFWTGKDRESIACLLAAVVEDGAAAVFGLQAQNERGQSFATEVMLLPLKHEGGPVHTRILGCFAPMEQPYWLGLHPVLRQPLQSLRLIWPDQKPAFLLRADQIGRGNEAVAADMAEPPAIIMTRPARTATPSRTRHVRHLQVIDGGRTD